MSELGDFTDRLNRFPDAVREAWGHAGPEVEVLSTAGIRGHFAASTAPDGTPWPPLGFPRPTGGTKPLQSTGLLAASCSSRVEGDTLVQRANAPGAGLHQEGGTVRPTRAGALTIPVTAEAARAGGARNFPRKLFAIAKGEGRGALAERMGKGKRAKLIVHYLLRASVTVPARAYLGVSARTAGLIAGAVGRHLATILRRLRGQ